MATNDITISQLPRPAANAAPSTGSLLPIVNTDDNQNYAMPISLLKTILGLASATDLASTALTLKTDYDTRRTATYQGSTVAGIDIPSGAIGVWTTNPATLWTRQTTYSGPATSEYVQALSGTWYRKIWSASAFDDVIADTQFRRVSVHTGATPAGEVMPTGVDAIITTNPYAFWTVQNTYTGPATSEYVQISGGAWFKRVFNSQDLADIATTLTAALTQLDNDVNAALSDLEADLTAAIAVESAARVSLAGELQTFGESLSGILEEVSFSAGQPTEFAGLSNTSLVNSKTQAIASVEGGKVTQIRLYATNSAAVSGVKLRTWSVSGTTITKVAEKEVTVQPGLNVFTGLDLTIPAGGAFGIVSNTTVTVGLNTSALIAIPVLYTNTIADSVTTSTSNFTIMMDCEIETVRDILTPEVNGLLGLFEDTSDIYAQQTDLSALTTTTLAGVNIMVFENAVIENQGTLTALNVVMAAAGLRKVFVWDTDGAGNYTLAYSQDVALVVGYNRIELDVPVTAGQVLGYGGQLGTSTTLPLIQTRYKSSGTTVGPSDSAQGFRWMISYEVTYKKIKGSAEASAVKRMVAALFDGQSNMLGQTSSAVSGPAYGNKMFASGLQTISGTPDRTALAALTEASTTTGISLAFAYAVELEIAAKGLTDYTEATYYFGTCPALGGAKIENLLGNDGTNWPAARLDLQKMGGAIRAAAYDPFLAFFVWVHGYANRADTRAVYAAKLRTAYARIVGLAGATIAGRPRLLAAQMPHHRQDSSGSRTPTVAMAIRDIALEVSGELFQTYPAEWGDSGIHMTTAGNTYKGLMMGKLIYDLTEGAGYDHVRLVASTWGSTSATLKILGGTGAYAFDTTRVSAAPNMGFDAYSSADVLLTGVVTAASLSGTTITLTLSRALVTGEKITYGWGRSDMVVPGLNGAANGPYALGNLRDTDTRSRAVSGVTYELFNWCAISEVVR